MVCPDGVSLSPEKNRLSCKRLMKERCEKVSAKGLESVREDGGVSHKRRGEKVWRSGGWKGGKFDEVKKRVKRKL